MTCHVEGGFTLEQFQVGLEHFVRGGECKRVTLLGWERESETGFGETLLIYEDNSKGESGVFTLFPFQPEFWNRDCGRREADQGQAGGRGFSQPQRKERKVRAFVEEKRRSEGKGKIRGKGCVFGRRRVCWERNFSSPPDDSVVSGMRD